MEFSIVENLSGLQESIFNLSRGPQLHFGEKSKNWSNFIKFTDFPPFPLFGVPWAAVIYDMKLGLEVSQLRYTIPKNNKKVTGHFHRGGTNELFIY